MGKIDVKKLKKSLSLAHHKQIMQALGIPSYSEDNTFNDIDALVNGIKEFKEKFV